MIDEYCHKNQQVIELGFALKVIGISCDFSIF